MELEEDVDDGGARTRGGQREDGQHPVSDDDDGHDTRHPERAADEYGVHVDHNQRAAPGDHQPHDCH